MSISATAIQYFFPNSSGRNVHFGHHRSRPITVDRFQIRTQDVAYRNPFTTSHGISHAVRAIFVHLTATVQGKKYMGRGECRSDGYYGNTTESLLAFLNTFRKNGIWRRLPVNDLRQWHDMIQNHQQQRINVNSQEPSNKPAWSALDMAILDLQGQLSGKPLHQILQVRKPLKPFFESAYTIDLSQSENALRQKINYALQHDYRLLKVKVGGPADIKTLTLIRQMIPPHFRIIIDANAGWTTEKALGLIPEIAPLGVELIEEPFAKEISLSDRIKIYRVARAVNIPVFADESIHTRCELAEVSQYVDGINIKLIKTGGLSEARALITEARKRHLKVMLGWYVESSLSITAMAHLAPLADYLDLDGALLLKTDPFDAIKWQGNRFTLPNLPGIGAVPRKQT